MTSGPVCSSKFRVSRDNLHGVSNSLLPIRVLSDLNRSSGHDLFRRIKKGIAPMLKKSGSHASSARTYRRMVTALALSSLLVIQLLQLVPRFSRTARAAGSVSLSSLGTTYTENFNTLINGVNGTLSSAGIPNGWDFSESGTGANTTYRTGTGSDTTGDTYSFGTPTTSTERAFGQLRSGTVITTPRRELHQQYGQHDQFTRHLLHGRAMAHRRRLTLLTPNGGIFSTARTRPT